MMKKKNIIALFIVFLLFCGIFVITSLVSNARSPGSVNVSITCANCKTIFVYDAVKTEGDGDKKLIVKESDKQLVTKLSSKHPYLVEYEGEKGYENNSLNFKTEYNDKEIKLEPSFTNDRLAALLPQKQEAINAAIKKIGPAISLYDVQPGKLYKTGEWYGTTLKYKQLDITMDDTLRIILHEESGRWMLATDPPDITLSKYTYPKIPEDVLRSVNKL